jgi:hypothetical protein
MDKPKGKILVLGPGPEYKALRLEDPDLYEKYVQGVPERKKIAIIKRGQPGNLKDLEELYPPKRDKAGFIINSPSGSKGRGTMRSKYFNR